MTRSPGLNAVTPGPTLSTTPENSPPGENGNGGLVWYLPAMISVSKKFNPTASTLATTSPGPATGSGMSATSRSSGGPKWRQRMAFTDGRSAGWGRCHSMGGGGQRLRNITSFASAGARRTIRLHNAEFGTQSIAFGASFFFECQRHGDG